MSSHRDRHSQVDIRRQHASRPRRATGGPGLGDDLARLPAVVYRLATEGHDGPAEVNAAISDLVGYTPDEWVTDDLWRRAVHSDDRGRVLAAYAARRAGGDSGALEYRLVARDGRIVWVRDDSTAAAGDDGGGLVGVLIDITPLRELEVGLRSSEDRFLAAFDDAGIPLGISELDGRLVRVNRPHCELFGYDADELIGVDVRTLIVSEEREHAEIVRDDLIEGRVRSVQVERRYRHRDGSIVWARVTLSLLRDSDGQPTHVLAQLQDMTEQRRTEAALREADERYRTLVEHAPDIITRIDREFRHLYMNPAAERVVGIPADRWVGRTARELGLLESLCDTIERLATQVFASGVEAIDEFRYVGDGFTRDFEIQMIPEISTDGAVTTVLAVVREMTARVLVREQLEFQATHDSLTGLLNRRGFLDRLAASLAAGAVEAGSLAVLFIDLDDFKVANDSLGHAAGDQLLIDITQRLTSMMRNGDVVSRLGGDEFAILLSAPDAMSAAITVARRVLDMLRHPFVVNRKVIEVTASLGIAVNSTPGDEASDLLRWSDIAMYQAKTNGKSRWAIFEPAHHAEASTRIDRESELQLAIERDELTLEYQPLVSLATGEAVGYEALVRWNHPRLGLILPEEFVPFAEETSHDVALGAWVLRRALADAASWPPVPSTGEPPSLTINLSMRQLHDSELVEAMDAGLRESGFEPSRLILDVTEHSMMYRRDSSIEQVAAISALGVRVAIDRFGSGFTSLVSLRHCRIHALKIDRDIVTRLPDDHESAVIVAATVGLAHALEMQVIAVGVETAAQMTMLRDLGCDLAQGYLFGAPGSPARATIPPAG